MVQPSKKLGFRTKIKTSFNGGKRANIKAKEQIPWERFRLGMEAQRKIFEDKKYLEKLSWYRESANAIQGSQKERLGETKLPFGRRAVAGDTVTAQKGEESSPGAF